MGRANLLDQDYFLPENIIRTPNPLTQNDYTVLNPESYTLGSRNIFAVELLLKNIIALKNPNTILFGENHESSSHILVQARTLDHLAKSRQNKKILVSFEFPYNILYGYASKTYEVPLPEALETSFHHMDPKGHHALSIITAHNLYAAAQAGNRLFKIILDHDLPVCFSDVAETKCGYYLSPTDKLASEIAKNELGIDLAKDKIPFETLSDLDAIATRIRNETITHRCIRAKKKWGADLTFITVGETHIGGNERKKMSYEHSLTSCFKRALGKQAKLLSIYFCTKALGEKYAIENEIPSQMWRENPENTVIIRNFDVTQHPRSSRTESKHIELFSHFYPKAPALFQDTNWPKEKDGLIYIQKLLQAAEPII